MSKLVRSVGLAMAVASMSAASVAAQTQDFKFLSGNTGVSGYGISVGPYFGQALSEPGQPAIDLLCVDFIRDIAVGQTWTAYVTNLGGGSTANTYNPGDLIKYRKAVFLGLKFYDPTINHSQWGNIHAAIWNLFSPGLPAYNVGIQNWLTLADNNYNTSGIDFGQYAVVSDINGARLGVQEFIITTVPEPATWGMLGTGLVALVGMSQIRRRRQNQK